MEKLLKIAHKMLTEIEYGDSISIKQREPYTDEERENNELPMWYCCMCYKPLIKGDPGLKNVHRYRLSFGDQNSYCKECANYIEEYQETHGYDKYNFEDIIPYSQYIKRLERLETYKKNEVDIIGRRLNTILSRRRIKKIKKKDFIY